MTSPYDVARLERTRRFLHAFPSVANAPSNAICRKVGFTLIEACHVEYPPGHVMRCNDWRLDLAQLPSPSGEGRVGAGRITGRMAPGS